MSEFFNAIIGLFLLVLIIWGIIWTFRSVIGTNKINKTLEEVLKELKDIKSRLP